MSKLEKLEEELYGPEPDPELEKRLRQKVSLPKTIRRIPTAWTERRERAMKDKPANPLFFRLFLGGLAVLFIVGSAAFIFFYLGTRGQEIQLSIYDRGPVESGELYTVPIVVKNISNAVLKDVQATFILPTGSLIREFGEDKKAPPRLTKDIPDMRPGEERTLDMTVRMFGRAGDEKSVEAVILYRPENLRARFSVREVKSFLIGSVPLAISWDMPDTLSQGQEVDLDVRYTSNSTAPFENMALKLEYPPGFTFISADPAPSVGDSVWEVGSIDPREVGQIHIRGSIQGEQGEVKAFQGGLGIFDAITREWTPYSESSGESRIAVTPLAVTNSRLATGDPSLASPGDRVDFFVRYKNNTPYPLKNVTIRSVLGSPVVDFNTLTIGEKGVFDSVTKSIVWGPGNVPELRELDPGESGQLTMNVRLRSTPPVRSSADENMMIVLRSTITAAGIPQELQGTELTSEDTLEIKLRTKIAFVSRSLFRSSPIINSGPMPPKVGATTTYTILWEVRNFTSDLSNTEVIASLPPNVRWTGVVSPQQARIVFDAASNEVRWKIGDIPAGTGVITPAFVAAFQVAIVPSSLDIGKSVMLVGESRLIGVDVFTGERREEKLGFISTEVTEDPLVTRDDWRVVQ